MFLVRSKDIRHGFLLLGLHCVTLSEQNWESFIKSNIVNFLTVLVRNFGLIFLRSVNKQSNFVFLLFVNIDLSTREYDPPKTQHITFQK